MLQGEIRRLRTLLDDIGAPMGEVPDFDKEAEKRIDAQRYQDCNYVDMMYQKAVGKQGETDDD
jgi:hypothetical protein